MQTVEEWQEAVLRMPYLSKSTQQTGQTLPKKVAAELEVAGMLHMLWVGVSVCECSVSKFKYSEKFLLERIPNLLIALIQERELESSPFRGVVVHHLVGVDEAPLVGASPHNNHVAEAWAQHVPSLTVDT